MTVFDESEPATLAPLADRRGEIILAAAYVIFSEKGIAGARVGDFAGRAHLSPEALAVRYGDKEGLFCAVLEWAARRSGLAPSMVTVRHATTALERLAAQSVRAMRMPEVVTLRRLIIAEGWKSPRIVGAYETSFIAPIRAVLTRIADAAPAHGAEIEDRSEFESLFFGWLTAEADYALTGQTAYDHSQLSRAKACARRLMRAYAIAPKPN